jgi:hypothetical protein
MTARRYRVRVYNDGSEVLSDREYYLVVHELDTDEFLFHWPAKDTDY